MAGVKVVVKAPMMFKVPERPEAIDLRDLLDTETLATPVSMEPTPAYAPTTTRDFSPELAQSRAAQDNASEIASVSRLGSRIHAASFPGAKPDFSQAQSIEALGALPGKRLTEDMALDTAHVSAKRAREKADPNSLYNQVQRDALARAAPHLKERFGDAFDTLTADQIASFQPGVITQMNYDEGMLKRKESERHNRRQEDIDSYKALHPSAAISAGGAADRETFKRVDKLAAITGKFAEYNAAFDQIEKLAPGFTQGKVPGQFPLTDAQRFLIDKVPFGERVAKPEAIELRKSIMNALDTVQRDKSGAVLNPSETVFYQKELSDSLQAGPEAQALALKRLRETVERKQRDMTASYRAGTGPQSPMDIYQGAGGTGADFSSGLSDDEAAALGLE